MKNRKIVVLSAAALVLAGSMTIHSAMAYFTTNVSAQGGYTLSLGSKTEIEENVEAMTNISRSRIQEKQSAMSA